MYIPRTQMTLVLLGKRHCFVGLPFKNRGHWGSRWIYQVYVFFPSTKVAVVCGALTDVIVKPLDLGAEVCQTFGEQINEIEIRRCRACPKKNIDNDKDVPHHESNGIFTKESSRCYYFYFLQLEIWVISSQQHVRFLEGNFSCNLLEPLCVISHVYPLTCVKIAKMIY